MLRDEPLPWYVVTDAFSTLFAVDACTCNFEFDFNVGVERLIVTEGCVFDVTLLWAKIVETVLVDFESIEFLSIAESVEA